MANVGSLVVDLALESAQFIKGLKQAQAATTQAATAISSAMNLAKSAAVGFAGALSVDMFLGAIQNAFDYGDAIVDLADRTGATTKTIQELRYAAQLSGSSMENADAAIEKFAKNLGAAQNGNKAFTKTFADLGVTSTDTDTAIKQAMDGISKLGTVTARNQKTIELFGKSAGDLTALMSSGTQGFNELAAAAQSYGIVIDDHVLRNGGQVNDQLDTMKMILNAQMAGAIIQNADALMTLANAFIQAASAAANFFQQMDVKRLMSLQQNNPLKWDIPTVVAGRLQGKSIDDIQLDARRELKSTKAGRSAVFKQNADTYNAEIRKGTDKNLPWMQALRAENQQILEAELKARRGMRITAPTTNAPNLPTPTGSKTKTPKSAPNLKTDEELKAQWDRAFLSARSDLYRAQSNLTTDPTERQELEANQLRNRYFTNVADIDGDTGTDREVQEGKKRYTAEQAKQLKLIEKEIFDAEYDATVRDRNDEIARNRLDMSESLLKTDADMLSAQMGLARSSRERRDLSLKMVDNQFEQERLQLEAIQASETATAAEKAIAEARLKALPALQALATEGAKRQNQSPLEAYLDAIPKTADEINDQMEQIEVEGLQSLQDGISGLIDGSKTFGDVWKDLTKTILDGLIKIGLQQAIIKPLGNLLFGGGEGGGGGLLGSIFGGLIKGARANGGYTAPGTYLTGERGPELVTVGSNAHVTANRALRGAANDNPGGVHVSFGNITSNDPVMVKRLAMEAAMEIAPVLREQAVNATMTKLRRPGL